MHKAMLPSSIEWLEPYIYSSIVSASNNCTNLYHALQLLYPAIFHCKYVIDRSALLCCSRSLCNTVLWELTLIQTEFTLMN
jgi:hypothetical protein